MSLKRGHLDLLLTWVVGEVEAVDARLLAEFAHVGGHGALLGQRDDALAVRLRDGGRAWRGAVQVELRPCPHPLFAYRHLLRRTGHWRQKKSSLIESCRSVRGNQLSWFSGFANCDNAPF